MKCAFVEASELSNIVLGVSIPCTDSRRCGRAWRRPVSTPWPLAYGGGRFNYQGDHRDRFTGAAELPERGNRPMRHGSDWVKVNLINTRKLNKNAGPLLGFGMVVFVAEN